MKVLGIDPGYERLGVAVIEKLPTGKESVVFSTCLRTSAKLPLSERLFILGQELGNIISLYRPNVLALEELYFAKNSTTALRVAESRGVIQYVAQLHNIPCFEYHPNTIKIAITGYGAAKKEDIAFMVPKLISFDATKIIDDELDAIAVALTHFAHARSYPQVSP